HSGRETQAMAARTQPVQIITSDGDIAVNIASFGRHLRAANLSPATVRTYVEASELFATFLADPALPRDVAAIERQHVEAFITDQLERWKPATALNRYRGVQSLFRWLVEEGELRESPMARMRPPRVPEHSPEVLTEGQLKALLDTCEKHD